MAREISPKLMAPSGILSAENGSQIQSLTYQLYPGNPDTLEPAAVEPDKADKDEVGYDSEVTIHDSDESGASIFGLRRALHEVEEGDELSDSSSQGNDEMAVAERKSVYRWRTDNPLLDDQDFAYVFADFEEAYSHAEPAVAISWSRTRVLVAPDIVKD